jgi:hypothetical protein
MSVVVKRKGMRFIAELPPGDWKLTVMNGRVVAACPEHPPIILGMDGMSFEDLHIKHKELGPLIEVFPGKPAA